MRRVVNEAYSGGNVTNKHCPTTPKTPKYYW